MSFGETEDYFCVLDDFTVDASGFLQQLAGSSSLDPMICRVLAPPSQVYGLSLQKFPGEDFPPKKKTQKQPREPACRKDLQTRGGWLCETYRKSGQTWRSLFGKPYRNHLQFTKWVFEVGHKSILQQFGGGGPML